MNINWEEGVNEIGKIDGKKTIFVDPRILDQQKWKPWETKVKLKS